MGFFERLKQGLKKTKESILGQVNNIFKSFSKVDEDMLEELEEVLIASDVGVGVTSDIIEKLREAIKEKHISEPEIARTELMSILEDVIGDNEGTKALHKTFGYFCYRRQRCRKNNVYCKTCPQA